MAKNTKKGIEMLVMSILHREKRFDSIEQAKQHPEISELLKEADSNGWEIMMKLPRYDEPSYTKGFGSWTDGSPFTC